MYTVVIVIDGNYLQSHAVVNGEVMAKEPALWSEGVGSILRVKYGHEWSTHVQGSKSPSCSPGAVARVLTAAPSVRSLQELG